MKYKGYGKIEFVDKRKLAASEKLNKYKFKGNNTPLEQTALTIEKLYDPNNPCGSRDWDWKEFKFIRLL